jgi:uncharacterized membrane protein YdjX (TVP38/TMEM64 family)
VLVALVLALSIGGRHWLSLDSLRAHRDALQQSVAAHYWASLSLLSLVTIAQTAISVPLSPALIILAGMVFGLWVGTVSMVIATSLGSVLALLVVRYLARDFARTRVQRHPRGRKMLAAFHRHPDSYLLFLRFEPGIPLWLANIVSALTDISVLRFSLLTLVGVIPDTFVFANIGANLAKVKSAHELLSPGIIVALALLAILALVPVAIARLRRRGRS